MARNVKHKEEVVAEKKPGFSVYLGPSKVGVIQNGTIFSGDGSEDPVAMAAIDKYPAVKDLIIPDEELARANKDVITPGTVLHAKYRALSRE